MTAIKDQILPPAITLSAAAAGAAVAWGIGAPAPFLTGPAVFVTLVTLAGLPVGIPVLLRDLCFLALGLGIGGTVTPEVIQTAMTWPLSLAMLSVGLYLSILLSRGALIGGFGFDRMTALLSGTPGHLSYIMGLSTDLKSDVPRVALVQSVRVLLLTLLVPALLTIWGVEGNAVLPDYGRMPWGIIALLGVLAAVLGLLLRQLRIPAPFLLGGMAVSAIGHGSALTPGTLPAWITIGAFIVMGGLIGTRFKGTSGAEIRQSLAAGVATTLIACAVAAICAALVAQVIDLPFAVFLLAFAPGGVEVMAAMAVQLALEPAFVAAHHVLRLVVLTFLIPVMIRAERHRVGGPG